MKFNRVWVGAVALVACCLATPAHATDYFVANKCPNNGNGTAASCGSAGGAGAFNNLSTALTTATAGDTVTVYGPESGNSDYVTLNGTGYTNAAGFTFANSGTAGNLITLRNAPGERPVLRPCVAAETDLNNCNRPTLNANNKQYIKVTSDSCPTTGPGTLGFHIYGAVIFYDDGGASEASLAQGSEISCVEVERGYSSIDDGNWSGIWTYSQYGVILRHNYIHDITYAGMTNTGSQSSTTAVKLYLSPFAVVRNNTINHVIPTQAGGVDCKADCVGVQIYENDIRDVSICVRVENQETAGGPYTTNGATGSIVRNNLCVSAASSVRGAVRMEGGKTTDIAIFNNTFVNYLFGLEEVHDAAPICQGISWYNNALYGTTDAHVYLGDGQGTECALALSDYNFFGTGASQPRFRYNNTPYNTLANFTATGFDTHSTETADADFLFTNVGSGVYTLQGPSPLQSAGKVGGVSGGASIDVGAYTDTVTCLGYTCTAGGDVVAPVVAITAPTETSTATAALTTLAGTCSDNVGVSTVTWSNSAGGSGTATGTTSWTVSSVALLRGLNTITVTCADAATNTHQAAITIAYQPSQFRKVRIR